jgi:hypothetical protein
MKKLSKEAAELLLTISNNEELQAFAKELYPELGKKQLPKSWEDLEKIKGCYVDRYSYVKHTDSDCFTNENNKKVFATKEQAEASIAMAKLSQLMKVYNDGWEPDYLDEKAKYGIGYFGEILKVVIIYSTRNFLTFKDQETAVLFLENFRELIETAKPLL